MAWHSWDLFEEIVIDINVDVDVNVDDEAVVGAWAYRWSVMLLWWNKDVDDPCACVGFVVEDDLVDVVNVSDVLDAVAIENGARRAYGWSLETCFFFYKWDVLIRLSVDLSKLMIVIDISNV